MQLLQDGVIAALAAVGLATIVWFTVTALTHPRERVRSETAVIVPARGAAEALEHTVRTLESERYASGGFSRIIIADCGMDEDAAARGAAAVPRELRCDGLPTGRSRAAIRLNEREWREGHGRAHDGHRYDPGGRFPE